MNIRRTILKRLSAAIAPLLLAFSMSACSDEKPTASNDSLDSRPDGAETNAWTDDSLIVTFNAGPNQGKHEYVSGDRTTSSIKLSFSKNSGPTGAMFFEAQDLVSKDSGLQLGSLKRYTKGDYRVGKNTASTWRGGRISQGDECGEVSLAVDQGPQYRVKTYGNSIHCNDLEILAMTDWRKVGNIHKERQVSGRFNDTVKFRLNSPQGSDSLNADMAVDFVITQKELRY